MQLFAIAATFNKNDTETYNQNLEIITSYLKNRLSAEITEKYINLFKEYVDNFLSDPHYLSPSKITLRYVKIYRIAQKINQTLNTQDKFILLVRFYELLYIDKEISKDEKEIIDTLAEVFGFDKMEIDSLMAFVMSKYLEISDKKYLIIVNNKKTEFKEVHFKLEPNLDSPIYIFYLKSISTFIFKYEGTQKLRLTGRKITPNIINIFERGSIIKGLNIQPIYQTTIEHIFTQKENVSQIKLIADQLEFKFNPKSYGLHKLSFEFESGQMIGIMGPSGSGKTTLVNTLVGKNKPTSGQVLINGHNIYDKKSKIKDIIGLVPQDDLLIEELTVWQNLYYSAKLIFGNISEKKIIEKVDKILTELDLFDYRHLKVGSPLNKFISGGQRKRLNIALELIREPSIMFIDEPTSGLSSLDSELVMDLLKHQSISGKLIIVNIHQPSSEIFKLFDKILILDKGGYPAYIGNPLEAIAYFKQINNYVDYEQIECHSCGNVKTNEILDIVEEKAIDQNGKPTQIRKTSPKEWYTLFRVNLEKRSRIKIQKKDIPKSPIHRPNPLKQFFIFITRDVLSKIADKQYLLINFLEAPALSLILSFFSKKIPANGQYTFAENSNIPVFLFMIVVVAMFLGMSCSAEELIKDRKIIERERFLNLNRFSYLTSKTTILTVLSAYQSFSFLIISFKILLIPANFYIFWLIMFLTLFASNMIGLLISSFSKNIVTVYISIPLILVPQMLLGGTMIKFEDMNPLVSSPKYVPIVADFMLSRWAYEALAVETFEHNQYNKYFFEVDKQKSYFLFVSAYLVPELRNQINNYEKYNAFQKNQILLLLKNEFLTLSQNNVFKQINLNILANEDTSFLQTNKNLILQTIDQIKEYSNIAFEQLNTYKDNTIAQIQSQNGNTYLFELKKKNYNEKLAEIMLEKYNTQIFIQNQNQIIRKKEPVFVDASNRFGRTHLYCTNKLIGRTLFETTFFNSFILFIFSVLLFLLLYYNIAEKIPHVFKKRK